MSAKKKSGEDTVEIPVPSPSALGLWPDTGSARVQVDLGAATHQGHVRSANEDHYLVLRVGRALETLLTSLPATDLPARAEEVAYGLLVADGIGGAAGGELASRTAISLLVSLILHTPDWILSTGQEATEAVMRRIAERYRRIHAALREQGRADPDLSRMGTTMTLAGSLGNSVIIGHIGDSRAYLLRDGRMCQLTRDHTLVQALLDMGQLTPEQAARHPCRHVLTASLGGGSQNCEGDFHRAWLADGDQLLLCTDGLTNMVDAAGIMAILRQAASADEACKALVAAALANGGKDNVTVALARYRFQQ
jgi:serine/threonine protein phosphatase PrpC